MVETTKSRLIIIRRILNHPWIKAALAVWAIIAAYDTFSSQILPEWLAAKAPKVRELVIMTSGWLPYWAWLLILAALLVAASFEYAFRRVSPVPGASPSATPRNSLRKMIAIVGMIVCGAGFFGFAAAYFWPSKTSVADIPTTPASLKSPWKHTLEDLYKTDFNLMSLQHDVTVTAGKSKDDPDAITITMNFRVWQDFNSGSDFIAVFIPLSHNIKTDGAIYDISVLMRDEIRKHYDDLKNSIGTGMGGRGTPYIESKDLHFSGRVFIYTDQPFTPIQIGDLTKWYQDAGYALQIRGGDYWWANKDR